MGTFFKTFVLIFFSLPTDSSNPMQSTSFPYFPDFSPNDQSINNNNGSIDMSKSHMDVPPGKRMNYFLFGQRLLNFLYRTPCNKICFKKKLLFTLIIIHCTNSTKNTFCSLIQPTISSLTVTFLAC